MDYYRYWLAGSSTRFAHGLKMKFGPEAYRLIYNAAFDFNDDGVVNAADNFQFKQSMSINFASAGVVYTI